MSEELFWGLARELLTEKQFRVLELRDRYGMSWSQVAGALGIGEPTARGHLRAAYHALGKHFDKPKEAA